MRTEPLPLEGHGGTRAPPGDSVSPNVRGRVALGYRTGVEKSTGVRWCVHVLLCRSCPSAGLLT